MSKASSGRPPRGAIAPPWVRTRRRSPSRTRRSLRMVTARDAEAPASSVTRARPSSSTIRAISCCRSRAKTPSGSVGGLRGHGVSSGLSRLRLLTITHTLHLDRVECQDTEIRTAARSVTHASSRSDPFTVVCAGTPVVAGTIDPGRGARPRRRSRSRLSADRDRPGTLASARSSATRDQALSASWRKDPASSRRRRIAPRNRAPSSPSTSRWSADRVSFMIERTASPSPMATAVGIALDDREDGGLAGVDDRAELLDAEHAQVGDRERAAGHVVDRERALAGAAARRGGPVVELADRQPVGVADDRARRARRGATRRGRGGPGGAARPRRRRCAS